MATVHLAVQESVDREVALKLMSPVLLADPDFGDRFLREAKIAAKLHHRHVVAIHDVGRHEDYHYMAMEYLSGGPILTKDGQPRPVPFALRVTREIATALAYANSKGFVHRDVKPDNILLRDDGSSVLTDFGIARAHDSAARMTRTGAVIGTPHYMSPEQARGRTVDGRSDLYSLGVVLYELLVGRVPYSADDSLAVGIMHITQSIPALPPALATLQPLLDKMLAKRPEDRYQDGDEVAAAIETLEYAIARGEHLDLAVPDEAYQREILGAVTPRQNEPITSPVPAVAVPRQREDPSFGRLDDLTNLTERRPSSGAAAAAHGHRETEPKSAWMSSKRMMWAAIAFSALIIAVGAVRYQDRLRALVPNTELNDLIARADTALATGKLVGNQGDSARELYQMARTIDNDNDAARRGLAKVGERLIEQARVALSRSDLETARSLLATARELLAGGSEVERLETDLRAAESRITATEDLLTRAEAALTQGLLLGDNSAAQLYQRVLDADPGNALALNGLKKVAEGLVHEARAAIAANNLPLARQRIEDLALLSPNHPEVPELRGAIAKVHTDEASAQEQDLTRAEAQLRAGRFSGSADSAQILFQGVLKRDPNNVRAKAGLRKVAQALATQANAALDDNNLSSADKFLTQAEALAGDLPEVRAARSRLREAREQVDIANRRSALTPDQTAQIQKFLEGANQAIEAGNLIVPPGESAFDKYRAVLRLDANNAQALEGLKRIPVRARELFDQTLKAGTPNRARALLDALSDTEPQDPALPKMRERLADAYLDQAEQWLTDGQRSDATRALAAARQLNPANSRLAALEEKARTPNPGTE